MYQIFLGGNHMMSNEEVIKIVQKNKENLQPLVDEGYIFYDDLLEILEIVIDGDQVADAIQKVFDIEYAIAHETSINGMFSDYGIIILNNQLYEKKDELIKEHYN